MKKIYSSLAALALSVFMGGTAFASIVTVADGETTPSVAELDGKTLVLTDATATSILVNANQDLKTKPIAEIEDLNAIYPYVKFTKITDATVSEGGDALTADNLFTLQIINTDGKNFELWGHQGFINFQPGGNIIFALGSVTPKYGTDGWNLGLWAIEYEAGNGYVIHNVGRDAYLTPASNNPSAEKVYCRLFNDLKQIETIDLGGLNALITEAKAIDEPNAALAEMITKAEAVASKVGVTADEVDKVIAELQAAIKADKKDKLMANPQAGDDMTLFIVNPDFETKSTTGWECNLNMQNNGHFIANYAEMWNWHAADVVKAFIKQTITIPAGVYVLSADVSCENMTAAIYGGTSVKELSNLSKVAVEVEFTNDEAGEVEIGYKGLEALNEDPGWFAIDNVKLTYKEANITTGINNVNNAVVAKSGKFISNGNIVIVKDGQKYNVAGQAIK